MSEKPERFFSETGADAIIGLPLRLRQAIGDKRGQTSAFARKIGMQDTMLRRYLDGKVLPSIGVIFELADAAGVRPEWLFSGEEPMRAEDSHKKDLFLAAMTEYTLVPRRDVVASAGDAVLLPAEEIVDYVLFKTDFLRRQLGLDPERLTAIQAKGDSMAPTILSGDLLLVDLSQARDADSAIYVINVDGRILVKRLQFLFDGSIEVISDNPKYKTEVVKPTGIEPFRIVGRVVWTGSPI